MVSLHVALKPETKGLAGEKFFAAMKPGAFFINTSRAEVVDQAALEKAVDETTFAVGAPLHCFSSSSGHRDQTAR